MGQDVKVSAVMTAGRYESTYSRNMIETALRELGISPVISLGVYYGQCMQRMLEGVCEIGADIVVTIDGDSIFKASHVNRLLSILSQEDKIDALASLQLRRGKADLLGACEGKTELQWSGYPLRLTSAHFGLTAIKVDKLRSVAKPWFFSQPDKDGGWDEDKIDDDVWFWKQWREAGNSLYMDPGCRIGHMEEMIATFDDDMQPCHVYPADWK